MKIEKQMDIFLESLEDLLKFVYEVTIQNDYDDICESIVILYDNHILCYASEIVNRHLVKHSVPGQRIYPNSLIKINRSGRKETDNQFFLKQLNNKKQNNGKLKSPMPCYNDYSPQYRISKSYITSMIQSLNQNWQSTELNLCYALLSSDKKSTKRNPRIHLNRLVKMIYRRQLQLVTKLVENFFSLENQLNNFVLIYNVTVHEEKTPEINRCRTEKIIMLMIQLNKILSIFYFWCRSFFFPKHIKKCNNHKKSINLKNKKQRRFTGYSVNTFENIKDMNITEWKEPTLTLNSSFEMLFDNIRKNIFDCSVDLLTIIQISFSHVLSASELLKPTATDLHSLLQLYKRYNNIFFEPNPMLTRFYIAIELFQSISSTFTNIADSEITKIINKLTKLQSEMITDVNDLLLERSKHTIQLMNKTPRKKHRFLLYLSENRLFSNFSSEHEYIIKCRKKVISKSIKKCCDLIKSTKSTSESSPFSFYVQDNQEKRQLTTKDDIDNIAPIRIPQNEIPPKLQCLNPYHFSRPYPNDASIISQCLSSEFRVVNIKKEVKTMLIDQILAQAVASTTQSTQKPSSDLYSVNYLIRISTYLILILKAVTGLTTIESRIIKSKDQQQTENMFFHGESSDSHDPKDPTYYSSTDALYLVDHAFVEERENIIYRSLKQHLNKRLSFVPISSSFLVPSNSNMYTSVVGEVNNLSKSKLWCFIVSSSKFGEEEKSERKNEDFVFFLLIKKIPDKLCSQSSLGYLESGKKKKNICFDVSVDNKSSHSITSSPTSNQNKRFVKKKNSLHHQQKIPSADSLQKIESLKKKKKKKFQNLFLLEIHFNKTSHITIFKKNQKIMSESEYTSNVDIDTDLFSSLYDESDQSETDTNFSLQNSDMEEDINYFPDPEFISSDYSSCSDDENHYENMDPTSFNQHSLEKKDRESLLRFLDKWYHRNQVLMPEFSGPDKAEKEKEILNEVCVQIRGLWLKKKLEEVEKYRQQTLKDTKLQQQQQQEKPSNRKQRIQPASTSSSVGNSNVKQINNKKNNNVIKIGSSDEENDNAVASETKTIQNKNINVKQSSVNNVTTTNTTLTNQTYNVQQRQQRNIDRYCRNNRFIQPMTTHDQQHLNHYFNHRNFHLSAVKIQQNPNDPLNPIIVVDLKHSVQNSSPIPTQHTSSFSPYGRIRHHRQQIRPPTNDPYPDYYRTSQTSSPTSSSNSSISNTSSSNSSIYIPNSNNTFDLNNIIFSDKIQQSTKPI